MTFPWYDCRHDPETNKGAWKKMRILTALVVLSISSVAAFAGPNCTCRFAGQNYKEGSIMCIRGKLSKCDLVLNNTSWKIIADTCPQAQAPLMSPIKQQKFAQLACVPAKVLIQ